MATVSNTVIPPAEWPKVLLGGRSYTVKYGMLANYELSRSGVSPDSVLNLLRNAEDPHNFSYIIDLWRACTAHEFKLADPPQTIPTIEQWIAAIEADTTEPLKRIVDGLKTAILKWSAERPAAAAPAQSEAATTNPTPPAPVN